MRDYMRRYRAERKARELVSERLHQAESPAVLRARERSRVWYQANRDRKLANVRAYMAVNLKKAALWKQRWRDKHRVPCPYCGISMGRASTACWNCTVRFGFPCSNNPSCGVTGEHKHCPCHMPITQFQTRTLRIEACGVCLAEMKRYGCTHGELFLMCEGEQLEEAA
jgi:hypothetical protein